MQLKPGTILQSGKYRIIRTLGQGGFGITYEAEQVLLRRKVALKEFFMKDCCERDEATSRVTVGTGSQRALVEKFRGKFIREAQMMAGFNHPAIVRVLDVFEENGTAYYVMENLPGGSLADKVKKGGPLSEADAGRHIRQVADALAYIHSRNTVHLDVKPSNILLDENDHVVLIDFGISKHYDSSGEQTSSTPVGISKGYAPLEQGRDGDVSQFTPATDIYALGATWYYLVSGQVPPEASIIYEDGLPRPKGVSDRIWQAIEKAMQPRRKDRPQTVAAFLSILKTARIVAEPAPVEESRQKTEASDETVIVEKPRPQGTGRAYGHEWVDLGLSVKWAACNVGASSPEESGDYFAWGETRPKSEYSWLTYRFHIIGHSYDTVKFSRYNTKRKHGGMDNKSELDYSDDAARINWGGSWRIPTQIEQNELRDMCTWTWIMQNGIQGYRVTSKKNGNSIFLPAAGYWGNRSLINVGSCGLYWSSSLYIYSPTLASYLALDASYIYWNNFSRYAGLPIRPVTE